MDPDRSLVFVYNADSGLLNSIKDLFHKNFKPATYPCRLCALTYNNAGMISDWKRFTDGLDISVKFLHKDEFNDRFQNKDLGLPAAFLIDDDEIRTLISAVEMNDLSDLEELIELVRSRI